MALQAAGAGAEAEAEIDADALAAAAAEALVAAQAEAAEWQDKFMRLHAEWDTYRRRTTEQREAEKARAAEKLVTSLLPVIDDFERTIDYATNNGETGLLGGVQAVHTKLLDVLKKDGLEVIDPQGAAFDALESQAVATVGRCQRARRNGGRSVPERLPLGNEGPAARHGDSDHGRPETREARRSGVGWARVA